MLFSMVILQSVLDYFEEDKTKNQSEVCAELINNRLIVTDKGNSKPIKLRVRFYLET